MILNVAKQFSDTPGGRYVSDGPYSGEAFRERLLLPALLRSNRVTVELDGTEGYGSSFLEEAFGGLVRLGHFSQSQLHERMELKTDDISLADEAWGYIAEAEQEARRKG